MNNTCIQIIIESLIIGDKLRQDVEPINLRQESNATCKKFNH